MLLFVQENQITLDIVHRPFHSKVIENVPNLLLLFSVSYGRKGNIIKNFKDGNIAFRPHLFLDKVVRNVILALLKKDHSSRIFILERRDFISKSHEEFRIKTFLPKCSLSLPLRCRDYFEIKNKIGRCFPLSNQKSCFKSFME